MTVKAISHRSFSQQDEKLQGYCVSHPGPGLIDTNKKTNKNGGEDETKKFWKKINP